MQGQEAEKTAKAVIIYCIGFPGCLSPKNDEDSLVVVSFIEEAVSVNGRLSIEETKFHRRSSK